MQRENFNGSQLRELLDTQHLSATNTFFPIGHTWRGTMGITSRIDYVVLPAAIRVCSSRILHKSARELQVIPAPGWRDHKPVQTIFRHVLGYSDAPVFHKTTWDRDALVQCVLYGRRRPEFLQAVENACAVSTDFLEPDHQWATLHKAVEKVSCQFFSQTRQKTKMHPQDTEDAFLDMVSARSKLVAQPQHCLFGLGSGSPMHQDLQILLQRWRLVARFRRARSRHDKLCKRDRVASDMLLVTEFMQSWKKRQMANVWQIARRLSGKALGPKRRRFDVPLREQPSRQEWEDFFAQTGPDGGCVATPAVFQDRFSCNACPMPAVRSDTAALQLAEGDLRRLSASIFRQKLRKTVPPWSLPAEIWRVLLFPDWYLRAPLFGLGYNRSSAGHTSTTKFRSCFLRLLTSIRQYDRAPLAWQTSMGHKIDKGNGKNGCSALRVVNCLDPLGKAYYTQLWRRAEARSYRHYATGYCKGKSRIEAMVQQHVVGYRLRKAHRSYDKCFFDVANAFYSPVHASLDAAVEQAALPADVCLLQQRYRSAAVCLDASDGLVCFSLQTGALQGDTSACDMFLEVYHPCFDGWNSHAPKIIVRDPITNFSNDALDLQAQVLALNRDFDVALAPVGMAQNSNKQEHVPFFGRNARQNYQQAFQSNLLPGKCGRAAKYLGGQQHHLDQVNDELQARKKAARVCWATFGRLWSRSGLPQRALCIIFAGTVVSALLSGLEALVLTADHLRQLDSIILTYGRKLMRGAACQKEVVNGVVQYKACSSRKVWDFLRLAPTPTAVELRIRRLRWLQQLVRRPLLHCNVLASLFGRFPNDPADAPVFSVHTNPWALQLQDDVFSLSELDSGACMVECLQQDFGKLFTVCREDFLYVDPTELRAQFFSVRIPPPGWVPDIRPELDEMVDDDDMPHVCDCTLDNGVVCGARFATLQQLAMHVRKTKSGNHGRVPEHYRAVVTNQCPWCRMVYSNIRNARIHVKSSLQHKVCQGRGSPNVFEPKIPSLECPICHVAFESLDMLHDHITLHFAGPWIHVP